MEQSLYGLCIIRDIANIRNSLALKILVSAADKASSAGFWAHFNIVTYYYYLLLLCALDGLR